ncbi:hypothetical protein CF029_08225 [Klebsiella quasipneumoniae]|nr:hypothetical protein [Klebsiella quasipneumoniae]
MLSRVKFHRYVIVDIFIFLIARFSSKWRYILLIAQLGSDMVHYPKNSWAIILAIFAQPLYYLTLISIFITFVQH